MAKRLMPRPNIAGFNVRHHGVGARESLIVKAISAKQVVDVERAYKWALLVPGTGLQEEIGGGNIVIAECLGRQGDYRQARGDQKQTSKNISRRRMNAIP